MNGNIRILRGFEMELVIPNTKISFRNGKRTKIEGDRKPDENGERKSRGFGSGKTHRLLGAGCF
jgi:hypothetical protein